MVYHPCNVRVNTLVVDMPKPKASYDDIRTKIFFYDHVFDFSMQI